jgi:hypothetical protein
LIADTRDPRADIMRDIPEAASMAHVRPWIRRAMVLIASILVAGCASPAGSSPTGCVAGMTCMTDNPGECAAGHTVCTDGKRTCMPDKTEQSCYSGEPETTNRGACHPGTQSCIGTLGACMGEQLPTMENCFNNSDDDCDRVVNNGCPDSFVLGAPDPLVARGGSGGNIAESMCPAGAVVTGVQIQLSATNMNPGYVISVQPTCAVPTLVRGATEYSVALMPVASPPPMSGSDAARPGTVHIACAAGGLSAATGTRGSVMSGDRTVIESLGINCSIVTLALDASNHLSLTYARDDASSGTAAVQVNGTPWNESCGANEVLIGFKGRTGAQMDQVEGVCAPLTVKYR